MENNNSNLRIPHGDNAVKPAAIWARVSTTSQAETSLPSQVSRCREKLEQTGYSVIHIFQVEWTSMDLFSCPEFQQLRNLIRSHEIEALAVFDRDRLDAKGLQRLIFLSECKDAGIAIVICQGSPIIDGPEGQIVELALAIGKERQVLRARQGSKDGLHDRAVIHKKPVTYHKLYGYQWEKENNRLVPDDNCENVRLIFNMLLEGASYNPIIQELKTRGILSPSGQPEWNKTAISNFIHNPAYAGRYFSLKKIAVEPKKRKVNSYGNSSVRKLPLDQAHYMPEVEIVNPPITWEQRGQILQQLEKHQKLSKRNANNDYLLRGMIFCETHLGKNGEPRRYHGQPNAHNRHRWRYTCPVGGCPHPHLEGFTLEKEVKEHVWQLLDINLDKMVKLQDSHIETGESIKRELSSLQAEYKRKIYALSQLEIKSLDGKILNDVYYETKSNLENRVKWIKSRWSELLDQITNLSQAKDAQDQLSKLSERYTAAWENEELTFEDWRQLFSLLNLQIHVYPRDVVLDKNDYGDPIYKVPGYEITICEHGKFITKKVDDKEELSTEFPFCEIRFGIDVGLGKQTELPNEIVREVKNIVLAYPEPG